MFDLRGRTALVTGAGQGIGAAIARRLAAAGAAVAVNDLDEARATRTATSLIEGGAAGLAVAFDVGDRAAVEAGVAAVEDRIGPVDILVNNAGVPAAARAVPFVEMGPDEWGAYIDVNLYGVLHCVKAVLAGMQERGWGRIITISSGAGTTGVGLGVSVYGAGKGGAISLMRHVAVESAPFGVTANTLALGIMANPDREAPRDVTIGMERLIPTGRLGTGDDVAAACVYLASDEAAWLTGQTIGLNGGMTTS